MKTALALVLCAGVLLAVLAAAAWMWSAGESGMPVLSAETDGDHGPEEAAELAGETIAGTARTPAVAGAPETLTPALTASDGQETESTPGDPQGAALVRVSGRVVDDAGQMVPAEVRYRHENGQSQASDTDAECRFTFVDVAPGGTRWEARSPAGRGSAELEILPGQTPDELVLTVVRSGRIEGRVLDSESQARAGVAVVLFEPDGDDQDLEESELDGTFVFDDIPPGDYHMIAFGGDLDDVESGEDWRRVFAETESQSVRVEAGATAYVEFRPSERRTVLVTGRVFAAEDPVANTDMFVFREDVGLLQSLRITRTSEDGSYALEVDQAGRFLFFIQVRRAGSKVEPVPWVRVEVPATQEHVADLHLSAGSIAGRVLGVDGKPVPRIEVRWSLESGARGFQLPDTDAGLNTDADGSFRLPFLAAGTYNLRAGDAARGSAVLSGVRVGAGEAVEGIEIRLPESGSIRGRVVDAQGQAVPGVAIYARDALGHALWTDPRVRSDSRGAFQIERAPAGRLTLSARGASTASGETRPLNVTPGETHEVTLTVEAGGTLRVRTDRAASLTVLDSDGLEVGSLLAPGHAAAALSRGYSSTDQIFGPLPPGRYRVVARGLDGTGSSATVEVRAGANGVAQRELSLALR